MESRRVGKFKINDGVIHSNPKVVKLIMSYCIILRCEYMYADAAFHYIAYCDLFDEIPIDQIPPEYDIFYDTETKAPTVKRLP